MQMWTQWYKWSHIYAWETVFLILMLWCNKPWDYDTAVYVIITTNIHYLPETELPGAPFITSLIARFVGPTWDPPGADGRTQVGPIWATWKLLFGIHQTFLALCIGAPIIYVNHVAERTYIHILFSHRSRWFQNKQLFTYRDVTDTWAVR